MKKWLITIIFLLATIPCFSQFLFIADSLKYEDTTYTKKIDGGLNLGQWMIIGTDTGTVVIDSVRVWGGYVRKTTRGVAVDTIWSLIPFKDSTFTSTTILAAAGHSYAWLAALPMPQIIRIEMYNEDVVQTRRWNFLLIGWKN